MTRLYLNVTKKLYIIDVGYDLDNILEHLQNSFDLSLC